jgi:hypothetical protein
MAIEAVDMVRAELVRLSNAYRPRVLSEQDRATGP